MRTEPDGTQTEPDETQKSQNTQKASETEKDPIDGAEICAKCGVLGVDRRTLWMACFYAMNETGVPFEQLALHGVVLKPVEPKQYTQFGSPVFERPPFGSYLESQSNLHPVFTLRVCKGCRAGWIDAIKQWFRAPVTDTGRWNRDELSYLPNDNLPAITAELERLRVESAAVEHRIAVFLNSAKREEKRREMEDSTTSAREREK